MKRVAAFAWLSLFVPCIASAFDPAAMHEKYTVGANYHLMGATGVELRNVDGLPGDEVLLGYLSMWHLLRWDEKTQTFAQLGFYENGVGNIFGGGGLQNVTFAQLEGQPLEVAALSDSSVIGLFSLDGTLRTTWAPPVKDIVQFHFVDLDGKTGDEVILRTCSELSAWQFKATTPLWRTALDKCGYSVVAQLDSDPQLEIAAGFGDVFDSKSGQREWHYPLGFGSWLATGDLNGDGTPDLIGCRGRQCDAFDVGRKTTMWETFAPYTDDVGIVAASDIDGDGKAEVFTGTAQHGAIRRLSGATGDIVGEIPNVGGTNFIVAGNLDGDCDVEIVWGKDGYSTGLDTMHIGDAAQMKLLWSSVPEERGSSGVVFGDFSGDGMPSILWASRGGSILRFASPDRRVRTVREIGTTYSGSAMSLPVVTAGQFDADPAMEYVLPVSAGDISGYGHVAVYDGATDQRQWDVVATGNNTITSMTAGDLNGDGVLDVVVGSSVRTFPSGEAQGVIAVDGATHKVLWKGKDGSPLEVDAGGSCVSCVVEVVMHDLDGDGAKEVLSTVPNYGLSAYDRNGTLLWNRKELAGTWAFTVAELDAASPGAEIVVSFYGRGKITMYNANATTVLREKDIRQQFGGALSLAVADLDGDGAPELAAVADGSLLILDARTLDTLWTGGFILPWLSLGNQILIADIDGDSTREIVTGSAHSLRIFEYRPNTADAGAPTFRDGSLHAAAPSGCCSMSLQWPPATDSASMPVKYRVYRSTSPDFPRDATTFLAQTAIESHVDRALSAKTTYYYAVTAVDSAGNESSVAVRGTAMAPPTCKVQSRHRSARH